MASRTFGRLLALLAIGLVTACGGSRSAPSAEKPSPAASPAAAAPVPARPELILATTTSTQDSGLLDDLLPEFEKATGYRTKPIAVGSGQALTLGERGEADVLLVHSPAAERAFMAGGHGVNRHLVMHNDFIIVGPANDPAGVRSSPNLPAALERITTTQALFLSRGDRSGTHVLEQSLWKKAGLTPAGQRWYQEVGQGMGQTLAIATEKAAYTISDRATFLARPPNNDLVIVREGDPDLLNVYHVIEVNPARWPSVNTAGARAFSDFLLAPTTQARIQEFGRAKYGQSLFQADGGRDPASLGQPD